MNGDAERLRSWELDNGMVVVSESMPWVESIGVSLVVPAGCVYDPADRLGLANFTCEMAERGAGERDSRDFLEAFEMLGVDWSSSVSLAHTAVGGAMLADRFEPALELFADLLRRPRLPVDQLEDARQSCLRELHALEDDLAQRVMAELRRRFYPAPWGRLTEGTEASLEAVSIDDVRQFHEACYRAGGSIISVAGKIDFDGMVPVVENLFGDWDRGTAPQLSTAPAPHGYHHIPHDSAQTHIAIACDSVPYRDPDYYQSRGAIGVLSDGMSSRLFTEVREKRGLVYSVSASCYSLKDRGAVFCYAGTTPDRAQETLDVVLAELVRLNEGVQQNELDRLKARIKSGLIMQQESSAARSRQLASSWYYLDRLRSIDEISRFIDELSCDSINDYLNRHPLGDFTIVTLGPEPLEVPRDLSTAST